MSVEYMPLPPKLDVKISLLSTSGQFVFGILGFLFCGSICLLGAWGLFSGHELPTIMALGLVVFGAMGWIVCTGSLIQDLRNLSRYLAKAPMFSLTQGALFLNDVSVSWSRITASSIRRVVTGKGPSWTYATLTLADSECYADYDLTYSAMPFLFKVHRRRFALPPNTLLVPLEGFDYSAFELWVLIQRYWCQATNRMYQPKSLELLYPQKTFKDFQKAD